MQDKPGIAVAEQVEAPVAGANLPAKALEFCSAAAITNFGLPKSLAGWVCPWSALSA